MSYIGSWKIDDLLTFVCNTQVFSTGVATDADSVPTYRVYEDETTTPILTGSMALLDSANTAGYYSEQITLSTGNGFENGKSYSIYIAATVSSVAGATHRTFQICAPVDVQTIKTNPVVNGGTITYPTNATIASTTNISAGTITTASNLTTNNDKTGYALSAAGVTAIWAEVMEGATSAVKMMRGFASALLSKVSGMTSGASTPVFRDVGDSKDRITATTDANGNRSAVTLDLT